MNNKLPVIPGMLQPVPTNAITVYDLIKHRRDSLKNAVELTKLEIERCEVAMLAIENWEEDQKKLREIA